MSLPITRKTLLVSAWLGVFGMLAVLASPMSTATAAVLLIAGAIAPAIVLMLSTEQPQTVAQIIRDAEVSRTE
jgi:ABC-type transport system involved in multi-copper enzyme maturation permease subunit